MSYINILASRPIADLTDEDWISAQESFLASCVALPVGSFLPLPREFVPNEEAGVTLFTTGCRFIQSWDMIEEIKSAICDTEFMNEKYLLPRDEVLVLLNTHNGWKVYHLSL